MHSYRRGFSSTVAALFILTAQLVFAAVGPIADAQEPNSVQIHLHKPHQEHAAHNPDSCALCLALNAGVLPAAALEVPTAGTIACADPAPEPSQTRSQEHAALQLARAPPACI